MTIFERVRRLNLPGGEYAVFGGGLMEAFGLREARDVDLVVSQKLYDRLKGEDWTEVMGPHATTLTKDDVEMARPAEYVPAASGIDDPERLISDSLEIEGVSFVRPEYVIVCKRHYQNPKHRIDVAVLESYLEDHPEVRRP